MQNITINHYLIYVPIVSTGTGLYQLLKTEEAAPASLDEKRIEVLDPHEKAKLFLSIIPFLGNLIVALINLAEKLFPAKVQAKEEFKVPDGYQLVKSEEVASLDARFQAQIKAATIRGVEGARLVVKTELEKEHQEEIDRIKLEYDLKIASVVKDGQIPEGYELVKSEDLVKKTVIPKGYELVHIEKFSSKMTSMQDNLTKKFDEAVLNVVESTRSKVTAELKAEHEKEVKALEEENKKLLSLVSASK